MHAVDLPTTNAQEANFPGAGLRFANLERAVLKKAVLSKSYAPFVWGKEANFENTDLSGAYFSGAILDSDVTFVNATIENTEFTGAVSDKFVLSQKQKKGACRHPKKDTTDWDVRLLEQRVSDRFKSG